MSRDDEAFGGKKNTRYILCVGLLSHHHHDAYSKCKTNAFIDSTKTDFDDDFDDFDDDTRRIVFKVVVVVVLCAPSEGAKGTTRQSRDATFTTRGVRALFSRDDFISGR